MEEQEKNKKKWVKFDAHTWKNVLPETLGPNSMFVRLACKRFFTIGRVNHLLPSLAALLSSLALNPHAAKLKMKKKTQKPA